MKQNITLSKLVCFLFFVAFAVTGRSQVVTNGADDGSDGTLRREIEEAEEGSTITFEVSTVTLNNEIEIAKDLSLSGNVIIDAAGNSRIFNITAGTVKLSQLQLTNGMAADGGAVYLSNSSLELDEVSLFNNIANGEGGSGGAIFVGENAYLSAKNSVFENNQANRAGGAIEGAYGAADGITLVDTDFTGNNAGVAPATAAPGNGGAIHITGAGNSSISGGMYKDNEAAAEGGALWNGTGTMTLSNTEIVENIAYGDEADNGGGGIFNNGGDLNVSEGTKIAQNKATGVSGSGGGLFSTAGTIILNTINISFNTANRAGAGIEIIEGHLQSIDTEITNNEFDEPKPGNGGGIHVSGEALVEIDGGTINGNIAGGCGGGLWNQAEATMNVQNTWVINNISEAGEVNEGGAGIFNNGGTLNVLGNTRVTANTARGTSASGGGILSTAGAVHIENAEVYENLANRAGAGIELIEGTLRVMNSDIYNNSFDEPAPGNGGGLHVTGNANIDFEGGNVWDNVAANEGGGLWNGGGTMTINATVFYDNIAQGNTVSDPMEIKGGGAIFANDNGTLIINEGTYFHDNYATGEGGSGGAILMAANTSLRINGTEEHPVMIESNAANRAGGGIEDWSSNTEGNILSYVNFSGNSAGVAIDGFNAVAAPGNGGAIHITGNANMDIENIIATSNRAAAEGGGFWNGTGTMTVNNGLFDANIAYGDDATNGGGALFNNGGTLNVWYSDIANNEAAGEAGSGGGIQNVAGGALNVNSTDISENMANRAGGGIEDNSSETVGTVQLTNVTLDNNRTGTAPGNGGGFHITGPGNSWITTSTLSNNYAANQGGGLWNGAGDMKIATSTISGNMSGGTGGGIYNLAGSVFVNAATVVYNEADGMGGGIDTPEGSTTTLKNAIVALNTASSGMDLGNTGTYVSSDYNLVGQDDLDVFPTKSNDIVGTMESPVNPMIETLADNGGPTMTHALEQNSIAYNAANPNDMEPDQRGEEVFAGRRDIGAFEAQASLGLDDSSSVALSESSLYPNPTNGSSVQVNIPDAINGELNIDIIEIGSGKIVHSQKGQSGVNELQVGNLAIGTYVVRLITGNKVESLKLVLGR